MERILKVSAKIVLGLLALVVLFFTGALAESEFKYRYRIWKAPETDKVAIDNGRIVAERFSRWIAYNGRFPKDDSLMQEIAFGPGDVPNVLCDDSPMRFCYLSGEARDGDLVKVGSSSPNGKRGGQPFALRLQGQELIGYYDIYPKYPDKVEVSRGFR
jgi:hypothetical protein